MNNFIYIRKNTNLSQKNIHKDHPIQFNSIQSKQTKKYINPLCIEIENDDNEQEKKKCIIIMIIILIFILSFQTNLTTLEIDILYIYI